MKKIVIGFLIFFLSILTAYGQDADLLHQMDNTVKGLAVNIQKKLVEEKAEKIAVGQFTHKSSVTRLGSYWVNQLTGELGNMTGNPYILLSDRVTGADWIISGEIVEVAGIIRIYTRIIRSRDKAIEVTFYSNFERNGDLVRMLSRDGAGSSQDSDEWEPDSWDNPVPYEIGDDESAPLMNRIISAGGDEDFFLLAPEKNGRLVIETTGSTDTFMEFFNADTREKLAEDDDSGSNLNARIRCSVQEGKRYIALVRGCSSSDTGNYGFRAYFD